jgi:chorismate mutase/prephenate dehydratase
MELDDIREEIDRIDSELLPLFIKRMECAEKVAKIKAEKGLPVFNGGREGEILRSAAEKSGRHAGETRALFSYIMSMSRDTQYKILGSGKALRGTIKNAPPFVPEAKTAACLGQKGSFSHEALGRLFPGASAEFFSCFGDIFEAVKNGRADCGVLPVENSSAGSVGEVYDLILKYRFYISGALSLPVRDCLASREKDIAGVKAVYSHPQALKQCSEFLSGHTFKACPYQSTAQAARMAAETPGTAAVCSRHAADGYGLNVLADNIQNCDGNRTRFIVISRTLFIPPEANKISLCFSLPHSTGTLCSVLERFARAGLNLTKMESRPIPDKNFEYDFYLDFTGNVSDPDTLGLICSLYDELPRFSFLGNYTEK